MQLEVRLVLNFEIKCETHEYMKICPIHGEREENNEEGIKIDLCQIPVCRDCRQEIPIKQVDYERVHKFCRKGEKLYQVAKCAEILRIT